MGSKISINLIEQNIDKGFIGIFIYFESNI